MRIYALVVFSFTIFQAIGQNENLSTLFQFNKLQYNSAYAGSTEALDIGTNYRQQWRGVEGAPKTITAFAHKSFSQDRIGLGLSLVADKIGFLKSHSVKLDYAYRISFKNETKLSIGLRGQFDNTQFDWAQISIVENVDQIIPLNISPSSTFNVGVGVYYASPSFYIGASLPRFLRNSITSENYQGVNKFRTYHLMGGYVFKIGSKLHLSPSMLISYNNDSSLETNLSLSLLFLESFCIGGNYRVKESGSAFVKFPISDKLSVAFAMDYALSELSYFTTGSLEVMIEYNFLTKSEKVDNIRFF